MEENVPHFPQFPEDGEINFLNPNVEIELEDDEFALYRFGFDGAHFGMFQLAKHTGQVMMIHPLVNDENSEIFRRAAVKIRRKWREEIMLPSQEDE